MNHPLKAGRGFRSGLFRLRAWFRNCVLTRSNVVQVLTHLSLSLLLRPVLLSHGVPELLADLVIASIAVVVAQAIDDYLDREAGE